MATTKPRVPVRTESAPDKPAMPGPRTKDAPRTMKDLRRAHEGKKRPTASRGRSRTRSGRACASSASRIRGCSSSSEPRATSPTARSSPRCTSCGGRTSCPTTSTSCASAGGSTTTSYRAEIRASLEQHSRTKPIEDDTWSALRRSDRLPPRRLRRPRPVRRPVGAPRPDGSRAGHPRQPALLPRDAAVSLPRDHRPAGSRGSRPRAPRGRLAPRDHREAVRPGRRVREAPEPRDRQGLPRVAGLPHRPLPREGDRPQPPGLPVRQLAVRAALEPALRRPRADHRGRGDRRRGSRRVLRGDRRVARLPPEPPAAAARARGDGAARHVRCRRAAR